MAIFGTPNAFLGLDIGTSNIKLVELVNRRRRIELATYAQASLPNLLIHPNGDEQTAIIKTANTVASMLDAAHTSADTVIAALPSSIVFSTVVTLPPLPEKEINQAVHFAARDVVPADLTDMVLGWSRVGEAPHMDTDKTPVPEANSPDKPPTPALGESNIPIFVTAAPKNIVERYLKVMSLLKLEVKALEVETFPLVRALFDNPLAASGLIIDIGDQVTTFHIINAGIPRASRTIDYGVSAVQPLIDHVKSFLNTYTAHSQSSPAKVYVVGGGANLTDVDDAIAEALGRPVTLGDPWRGLSFPQGLEPRLQALGPAFAVAVGLALRGARGVQ